jgi:hypothetical protein
MTCRMDCAAERMVVLAHVLLRHELWLVPVRR